MGPRDEQEKPAFVSEEAVQDEPEVTTPASTISSSTLSGSSVGLLADDIRRSCGLSFFSSTIHGFRSPVFQNCFKKKPSQEGSGLGLGSS